MTVKLKRVGFYLLRDVANLARYRGAAPVSAQKIMVSPCDIELAMRPGIFNRLDSGRVVGGDWDKQVVAVSSLKKYNVCFERFVNGKSWQEAGAYDMMMKIVRDKPGADGCYNKQDIIKRYERLDVIFDKIKADGELRSRQQIAPRNFRESGGVYVHVDRYGDLIFSGAGVHRFSIAKILDIPRIPAQLGVVHEGAIEVWKKRFL